MSGMFTPLLVALVASHIPNVATSCPGTQEVRLQEPATREAEGSVAGRVLDTGGKPVAGATVSLIHRQIPSCVDSPAVRRKCVTDARGMFRVKVPKQRRFSAWATWPTGGSSIEEGVTAGSFLTLTASGGDIPVQLAVRGIDAWAEFAPLSFHVSVGSENIEFWVGEAVGGVLSIPRTPAMELSVLEVRAKNGALLWASEIPRIVRRGSRVVLPPLADVKVLVVGEDGKPIEGAEVFRHIRSYQYTRSLGISTRTRFRFLWPRVGVTDRDGVWRGRLPQPFLQTGKYSLHLLARAEGHGAKSSGWTAGHRYQNGALQSEASMAAASAKAGPGVAPVTFVLEKCARRTGRMRVGDSDYTGPVSLVWRVSIDCAKIGMPFREPLLQAVDGKLEYPVLQERFGLEQAWVALPPKTRERVAEEIGVRPPIALEIPTPETLASGVGSVDPYRRGAKRPVQVVLPDGRPAARAIVLFTPFVAGRPQLGGSQLVRTDRVGRALVPTAKEETYITVVSPDGWGGRPVPGISTRAIRDASVRRPVRLQLRRPSFVEGRVVGGKGGPIEGARVGYTRFRWSVRRRSEGTMPVTVMSHAVRCLGVVLTDANGSFRLPMVPSDGEVGLRVQPSARIRASNTVWVSCVPGANRRPITFTVRN